MDLETAVRERIPILTVLVNNSLMGGYERHIPLASEKYRSRYLSGDYAKLAEGLGVAVERVTQPAEIVPALQRAIRTTGYARAKRAWPAGVDRVHHGRGTRLSQTLVKRTGNPERLNVNSDLSGRVAIVTGRREDRPGDRALARAARACVVVGDYRLRSENEKVFADAGIRQQVCDVRREQDISRLVQLAIDDGGGIDILVNNAGIVMVGQIPDVSEADWDACLDTNFKAAFLFARSVIPSMRSRGGGAIVNISSNAGLLPRASTIRSIPRAKAALLNSQADQEPRLVARARPDSRQCGLSGAGL